MDYVLQLSLIANGNISPSCHGTVIHSTFNCTVTWSEEHSKSVRSPLFHHRTAWLHPPNPALTSIGADIRKDGLEVSDWDLKTQLALQEKTRKATPGSRIYSQCWLRLSKAALISCWKGLPYNNNNCHQTCRMMQREITQRTFPHHFTGVPLLTCHQLSETKDKITHFCEGALTVLNSSIRITFILISG